MRIDKLAMMAALALGTSGAAALAGEQRFNCGGTEVNVLTLDENVIMSAPGVLFLLEEMPAASGAKFGRPGDDGTYFWSRGSSALVSILGEELSECHEIPPFGEWHVLSIEEVPVPEDVEVTMEFSLFGTVSGKAACNRYNGGFEVQDGELIMGAAAMTRMACEPEVMEVEAAFAATFDRIEGFVLDDAARLVLTGVGGRPILLAERRSR